MTPTTNASTETAPRSAPIPDHFQMPEPLAVRIADAFSKGNLQDVMNVLADLKLDVETFTSSEHAEHLTTFPAIEITPVRITSVTGLNAYNASDLMIVTPEAVNAAEAVELLFRVMLRGDKLAEGCTISVLRQSGEVLDLVGMPDRGDISGCRTFILAFHPSVGLQRITSTELH